MSPKVPTTLETCVTSPFITLSPSFTHVHLHLYRCSRNFQSATSITAGVVESIRYKLALGGRTAFCSGSRALLANSSLHRCALTRSLPLAALVTAPVIAQLAAATAVAARVTGRMAHRDLMWHHVCCSDSRFLRLLCNFWSYSGDDRTASTSQVDTLLCCLSWEPSVYLLSVILYK